MISCVLNWARQEGFKEAWIQPAESNRWYNEGNSQSIDELMELRGRLKKRYNITARRMGFKYNSENKHWVKSIG